MNRKKTNNVDKNIIKKWLDNHDIENYIINKDFTIDVDGDVVIQDDDLEKLPEYIRFNKINGYFKCSHCDSLISCEGFPKEVTGDFDCSSCRGLTSLEGAPSKISGDFDCSYNVKLKSLKGAPVEIGGIFNCCGCDSLKDFDDVPKKAIEIIKPR